MHDVIRRMGYAPNAQARNLRTARTNVVVALVPDISNLFFAEVIRGIEQVAHKSRYSVLLGDTQYNRAREQGYADLLSTRQADGLITLLPHIPRVSAAGRLPIVNACEYVSDPSITSVYIDNVAASQQATEYLLTLGHRSVAFITGPMNSPISVDRDQGYEKALGGAGIKRNRRLTVEGDFSAESGIRGIESLYARGQRFKPPSFARTMKWRSAPYARSRRAGCEFRRTCRSSASTTSALPGLRTRRSRRLHSRWETSAAKR